MFKIYHQNNSGGYFHINKDEAPVVVIEGNSEEEIDLKARELLDNSDSCPCCGDRWYYDESVEEGNWKEKVYFGIFTTEIVFHGIDGRNLHFKDKKERKFSEIVKLSECEEIEFFSY